MTVAVFPLGRATFDVDLATATYQQMLDRLNVLETDLMAPAQILWNEEDTSRFFNEIKSKTVTRILILQITFTDAQAVSRIAEDLDLPLSIWATNEPRTGKRLRLNSFCGLNLASHALGLRSQAFSWLYKSPEATTTEDLNNLLFSKPRVQRAGEANQSSSKPMIQSNLPARLNIGIIGEHPPGFDTCQYDPEDLTNFFNISVHPIDLDALFATANEVSAETIASLLSSIRQMKGGTEVNQEELAKSLKLKIALDQIARAKKLEGFAVRCWPEMFTEHGGAVCGPVSLLGDQLIPCACEADVFGALSQLWIKNVVRKLTFLIDLVDVDTVSNTAVVWHCGQAPRAMSKRNYDAEVTVHTNRRKPLLFQFPLRAGRVTFFRISQSLGLYRAILISGEVIDDPLPFAGTSGTIRFDNPAGDVLNGLMQEGIEHHLALVYGDHVTELKRFARGFGLDIIEL